MALWLFQSRPCTPCPNRYSLLDYPTRLRRSLCSKSSDYSVRLPLKGNLVSIPSDDTLTDGPRRRAVRAATRPPEHYGERPVAPHLRHSVAVELNALPSHSILLPLILLVYKSGVLPL